jgi:hypothetical protein
MLSLSPSCGSDHPLECLCDVKITQPTPISAELTLGSVYADYVLRAYGTDILDSPGGLLDFLEALAQAKDAITPSQHTPPTFTETREAVIDYLRQPGSSLLDVEADLGLSMTVAVDALCHGRPSIMRTFDDMRWLEIEAVLENFTQSAWAFATAAGVTRATAVSILSYYRG